MCTSYNQRSNWDVYLVCQLINTHLYTIILCRIRVKLLTSTIEQNRRERERENKCCSHPSYRLQIFLEAYFGVPYPSCHREFFFLSSCYLIVQQRQQKIESSANGLEAKYILISLQCRMLYAS